MQAAAPSILVCPVCGQWHDGDVSALPEGVIVRCARCRSVLATRPIDSLQRTAALSLAALIMYVPANLFPVLRMQQYGVYSDNTVWQGSKALFDHGDYVIAVVVLLASIVIPLLKLIGLFYLAVSVHRGHVRGKRMRTWMLHAIEGIGRWAMLDVFIVAVLVSLVKLQGLATVMPGTGLFAFGSVVVLTLLASASFDPRLVWEANEDATDKGGGTDA